MKGFCDGFYMWGSIVKCVCSWFGLEWIGEVLLIRPYVCDPRSEGLVAKAIDKG
jgi:hypothetical protein